MQTKYVLMEKETGERYWASRHANGEVEALPVGFDLVFKTDPEGNPNTPALPFPAGTMVILDVPEKT